MNGKNIGLDIDGLLCNFTQGVIDRAKDMELEEYFPECCHNSGHWGISPKFSEVMKDAWLDPEFWLNLKPMEGSEDLDFTPTCYITSRPIDTEVTKTWLRKWNFPEAPVITVDHASEKVEHVQRLGLDLFVDDYYVTILEMRKAGLNAVLYYAPYQRGHEDDCAYLPTIKSFKEIGEYV